MTVSNGSDYFPARLRGGPIDGTIVRTRSASILVEVADRPAEVARYRKTREFDGTYPVYAFREWERIVARTRSLPGVRS